MREKSTEGLEINLETPERLFLIYLYNHPIQNIGTSDLLTLLKPETENAHLGEFRSEKIDEMLEEVQHEVESLILAKLVSGERILQSGKVRHTALKLTAKGECKAIEKKRSPKKLILDV
jgi:hypothetical protein